MRIYLEEKEHQLTAVVCNCCKKELLVENGILKEECIHIAHDFGYFSEKDGETESFDLCEACYSKMISKFRLPVSTKERKEWL